MLSNTRGSSWRLPSLEHRATSLASPDLRDARLLRSVKPRVQLHAGKSGIVELRDGREAFAARALLADAAEHTLDIQYYIWRNDMSGTLLFDALRRAADRGVRIRLLLDDNNTTGLDTLIAAIDSHPQIEVRLFNPFALRGWRALNYFTDFARLNRRMHNKTFTADNQVTIVGGRNIGDEYFDAHQEFSFVDLDVLAIGPVANDVSADFERYWQSASSYPAASILPRADRASTCKVAAAAEAVTRSPASIAYARALSTSRFVHAGYAKRRRHLLTSGVTIYELMRTSSHRTRGDRKLTGSSGSSLHAKTFSVDRARVFVGSFNLDPRSAALNTEMGLVMECPELAEDIAAGLTKGLPERCYHVRLRANGGLEWVEVRGDEEIVHTREPRAPWWRRAIVSLLALLPIEWLL